jgi:hypothetical protein
MFIAAPFTIAKRRKHAELVNGGRKQGKYTHWITTPSYFVAECVEVENRMLSEISQTQKDTHYTSIHEN